MAGLVPAISMRAGQPTSPSPDHPFQSKDTAMATLDLSRATQHVDMTDSDLVSFGTAEAATPTVWSWLTPAGHDLQLEGSGLTFNAQSRALSGTVQSIAIDLGNNDFDAPT
jgi:hypothetical protein